MYFLFWLAVFHRTAMYYFFSPCHRLPFKANTITAYYTLLEDTEDSHCWGSQHSQCVFDAADRIVMEVPGCNSTKESVQDGKPMDES